MGFRETLLVIVGALAVGMFMGVPALGREFVVAKDGSGDYTTIQAAVDAAKPGDSVYVKAGTYREHITLKKSGIMLKGEGYDATVIVYDGDDTVITVRDVDAGTIADLTIRYAGSAEHASIFVVNSRLVLISCSVEGATLAGIEVKGSDSEVLIVDNSIHGNTQSGIFLHTEAHGTVKKNEIYGNGYHGIEVRDADTEVLIEDNVIHDNGQTGVLVHDGAKATVRRNEIYGNKKLHGIEVRDRGTEVLIVDNSIYDNTRSGIFLHTEAHGTIKKNHIYSNGYQGISARDAGTEALIEDNAIYDNVHTGILIYDGVKATMRSNEIYGSKLFHGIEVRGTGTEVLIVDNVIHDNGQTGVLVHDGAKVTMRRNEIYGSGYHGIGARDGGTKLTVEDDIVVLNSYVGIWVFNQAQATLRGNTIALNGRAGIDVLGYQYGEDGSVVASNNNLWGNACPQYQGLAPPEIDVSQEPELAARFFAERPDAYLKLGQAYTRTGAWDKALEAFSQAEEAGAEKDRLLRNRAICYVFRGEYEKAAEEYRKILDENPDDATALVSLGWLLYLQGRYVEASVMFRKALTTSSTGFTAAVAHNNLGCVYFRRGELEKAVQEFETALQMIPSYKKTALLESNTMLGRALLALGDTERARSAFEAAIEAGEAVLDCYRYDRDFLANLGFSYWGLGQLSSARYLFKEASELALGDRAEDTIGREVQACLTGRCPVGNVLPVVLLSHPEMIYTNFAALFDASSSYDPDGEIVKYEWDFNGDGVVDAEGQKVEWTFTEEGTYTVVLIVTDDDGATARKELEIEVKVGGGGGPA